MTWYEFKKLIYYDSPKSYKKKLFFSSQPIVLSTFLSGDMNTSITRLWKAGGKNLKDPLTITITPRIKLELKQVFLMNSLSIRRIFISTKLKKIEEKTHIFSDIFKMYTQKKCKLHCLITTSCCLFCFINLTLINQINETPFNYNNMWIICLILQF